jgi:5-methylcytosine-specific restriction endonuclease McrA
MKRSGTRQFTHIEWVELKAFYKNRCVRCGRKETKKDPSTKLTIDHVIPISAGGSKGIGNIQPLCHACNQIKGKEFGVGTDYRWKRFKN